LEQKILEEEVHSFLRNVEKYPTGVASDDLNSQRHGCLETSNVASWYQVNTFAASYL